MASDAGSVIHDIGFRHYDGPRLGRGWITRSLLRETLRGTFGLGRPAKDKAMPWVLVGILTVPALVAAIIVIVMKNDALVFTYAGYPIAMQFPIMLFVASRAPYAVSRDLRHGVMPLYLSRPLTRSDYLLAKFGGLSAGVFLLLVIPELFLVFGALLAKLPVGENLWGFLGGLVVAALVAALVSAIGLAISAFTRRKGMGIAAVMMTLILLASVSGIALGLMGQMPQGNSGSTSAHGFVAAIDPFSLVNGLAVTLLGVESENGRPTPTGVDEGLLLVALFVLIIVSCLGILLRRYRKAGGL